MTHVSATVFDALRRNGFRRPIQPGQIIIDVGAHMNRILEIDETLCFEAIEPGAETLLPYRTWRARPCSRVRPAVRHE